MSEIFISYSRLDREFVDQLVEELERLGFDVWVDRKDIDGGTDWRAEISKAILGCHAFLVVLSTNSADSKKVVQELSLADEHGCKIIPLVYEACDIRPEMELQLTGKQRIDFTENSFEKAVNRLESALTGKSTTKKEVRREPLVEPPSLVKILPGVWQIQITHQLSGMMGQMGLELFPNGTFQGQLNGPTGQTMYQGVWQITPLNQLALQGQQSNGFMTAPYYVVLQFNKVTPNQLSGFSNLGDQVVCQKIR